MKQDRIILAAASIVALGLALQGILSVGLYSAAPAGQNFVWVMNRWTGQVHQCRSGDNVCD